MAHCKGRWTRTILGAPANSVMCFLQVPGAHMVQVQDKVKRLKRNHNTYISSPVPGGLQFHCMLGTTKSLNLNVRSTDGVE